MLKKEYYCLVAGLPDLFFHENKLKLNGLYFRHELKNQLILDDYKLFRYIFFPFDNKNLIRLIFEQKVPFNAYGLFSKEELEFQIAPENENPELPQYMYTFLNWVKEKDVKEWSLEAENKLNQGYYTCTLNTSNEFLKEWFIFELNTKNILTAFHCENQNHERSEQIIAVDQNPLNHLLLSNKTLKPELFEDEFPYTEQIFKVAKSEVSWIEKEKTMDKIKWNYLDENTFFHYFTIEKVLSYVLKILIVERWIKLDSDTGKTLLSKLLNELKTSYQFAEEFSLNK